MTNAEAERLKPFPTRILFGVFRPYTYMQSVAEGSVIEVTAANFKSLTENSTPVLIDFWAPWCGPCRMMKPILAEAATQLRGQVQVGQLNVDEEPAISDLFGVRSIPTCVLIKGGKVVDAIVGVVAADQLVSRVRRNIQTQ